MSRYIYIALLLGLVVAGCSSDEKTRYVRDGEEYGVTDGVFRGRWWSYYERGSSFLAGKFYDEAIADFEKALEGHSRDAWQARTYGLHFQEFFPNRELGIAYYHLDRLEESEEMLQRALSMVDTGRAQHYLTLVKKAKIAQGILEDGGAPALAVDTGDSILLTERDLPLHIEAGDDLGVEAVRVNGKILPQRNSDTDQAYEKELTFMEGRHTVSVAAQDLANKTSVQDIAVTVDLTGPTVGVFSPLDGAVQEGDTATLQLRIVDRYGLDRILLGDTVIAEAEGDGVQELSVDHELVLAKKGENTFIVTAVDKAGNETLTRIGVFKGQSTSTAALHWRFQEQHPNGVLVADASGLVVQHILSAVEGEGQIRLKSPVADRPYRHNKTLRVSGEVIVPTQVASLTINGEPFTDLTGAPKESFNRRIALDDSVADGSVVPLNIRVEIAGGTAVEQNMNVEMRPVSLNTQASKMPVAVLAFQGQGVAPEINDLLRTSLEGVLVNENRFRTLDRINLQDVLTEQQLSDALSSPDEALTLGKLTPAHVFLVADIFTHGAGGVEIKARVINTETSAIVAVLDAFVEDHKDRDAVAQACENLAAQINALYPRLSGEVLSARGAQVLLNWTAEDGLREGAQVLLVHEEAPWIDESTGEVLEPGQYIEVGRVQVQSSSTGTRAATVGQTKEGVALEQGMPAITM